MVVEKTERDTEYIKTLQEDIERNGVILFEYRILIKMYKRNNSKSEIFLFKETKELSFSSFDLFKSFKISLLLWISSLRPLSDSKISFKSLTLLGMSSIIYYIKRIYIININL